ncbi:MAG: 2-oxo acid dehydrogenase subunit E2 [Burkholderiales bacterium]|nr:2-oxo acid dehydrogenase subunit E2 [Burkholderiales bacterium]
MSAPVEIRVPDIGDFKDIPVIDVLVHPGDSIKAEDPLVTLESDKATMDVPAPAGGVVKEVKVKVGDKVSQGSLVLLLDAALASEASAVAQQPAPSASGKAAAPAPSPAASAAPAPSERAPVASTRSTSQSAADAAPRPAQAHGDSSAAPRRPAGQRDELPPPAPAAEARPPMAPSNVDEAAIATAHASPAVRRAARELGVDLARVHGSGPKGRILKEDVQAYVKQALAKPPAALAAGPGLPPWPQVDFAKFGAIEALALTRIQKLSGPNLARNWAMIPHVTQHDEADITELEGFRKAQAEAAERDGVRLTLLAFVMKAVVAALKQYPGFNASLGADGESLILKKYFHIGVAVDTADGLVVPVIRDVDAKGVLQLARELATMSAKARDKKLAPADLQGGSFSISSLGGIGGSAFTPIINAPEVAILGVSRALMRPVYVEGRFEPRLMLPLSLSYDHRVIDGAQGARFITSVSGWLADIRRLVL